MILFVSLFILLFTFACSISYSQELTSGGKLKPEQAIMDIRHYTINLAVDIDQKSISGFTIIDLMLSQSTPVLLFDLMNDMKVEKICMRPILLPTKLNALYVKTASIPTTKY